MDCRLDRCHVRRDVRHIAGSQGAIPAEVVVWTKPPRLAEGSLMGTPWPMPRILQGRPRLGRHDCGPYWLRRPVAGRPATSVGYLFRGHSEAFSICASRREMSRIPVATPTPLSGSLWLACPGLRCSAVLPAHYRTSRSIRQYGYT